MNDVPINCLKCYRIHKCGEGLFFCPFFAVNPCIRGEHYVPANAVLKKPKAAPAEKPKPIPEFKPPMRKPNSIEWEKYHNEIFTRYNNGEALPDIAKSLGIGVDNVRRYIERY